MKNKAVFGETKWLMRPAVIRSEEVRDNRRWFNPTLRAELVPPMIQRQGTRLTVERFNSFDWYRGTLNPRP